MSAFHEALSTMLADAVPGFAGLQSAERLTAGASQETWRLVVLTGAGEKTLCLRRNAGAVAAGEVTPGVEARLMQAARRAGIPEPEIHHILQPGQGLGEGFLMEWLEGETLGGRIVHSRKFAQVRPRLARQCGETLARLHQIDPVSAGLENSLPVASPEQLVRATWQQYREFETPQPMLDYTGRWLLDHLPAAHGNHLVHGDFRNGNLMVSPERGITAVLDWELAGIGDPVRDLGWVCTNSWRFGRPDLQVGGFGRIKDLLEGYRDISGEEVDREHLRFWMVFGSFWWSVCCLIMANSYRTGENPSVERPAIGRRASEGQADCVAMLVPGPVQLPALAAPTSDALPRADELLDSVVGFLRNELAGQLQGAPGYLSRVAANSLAIVRREQAQAPAFEHAESERLQSLGCDGDGLDQRRWALVHKLRDDLPLEADGLADHLRTTIMGQLSIDQPAYRVTPTAAVSAFWDRYLASLADPAEALARGYAAWYFCDNKADADECAALVLAGRKRASASALWHYEKTGDALPTAGELSVVTNWDGEPLCVIRTTGVETVPFDAVNAEFAAREGEGDGSLEYWRRVHRAFYSRTLAPLGLAPAPDMPVVCEDFEVVFTA